MSLNTKLFKIILIASSFFEPLYLMSMSYDEAKNRCENSVQNIKEIIASDPKKYNASLLKKVIPILESSILNMVKKKESDWIEEYFRYQDGLQAVNWILEHHENLIPLQQHQTEQNFSPKNSKENLVSKVVMQNKKPAVSQKHTKHPKIINLSSPKTTIKKTKLNQKIKKSKIPLKKKT